MFFFLFSSLSSTWAQFLFTIGHFIVEITLIQNDHEHDMGEQGGRNSCFAQLNPKAKVLDEEKEVTKTLVSLLVVVQKL